MKRAISAVAMTVALFGCATLPPMVQRPEFQESEYLELAKEGTGTVRGQVFLRTRGGDVKYGAGSEVTLNPVTSYSRFWYSEGHVKNQRLSPPDSRQDKYIISTQADGNGNFEFNNVPPGKYFLVSNVTWEIPITAYTSSTQGGYIAQEIEVENGKDVRVMLTR